MPQTVVPMDELRLVSVGGVTHGTGFPTQELEDAFDHDPHFVGIDTGSIEPGPYYLGSGENQYPSIPILKEILKEVLSITRREDVPLLIGSAATAGARPHVDFLKDLITEVSNELEASYKLATIYSDIESSYLIDKINDGKSEPIEGVTEITRSDVEDAENIVACMGPEPFIEALNQDADVVIAGRASDVSIFSAMAIKQGFPEGLAHHLAKTVECGGAPIEGATHAVGELTHDHFIVRPPSSDQSTSPMEVASHLLYETTNPYSFIEPRGVYETERCTFEQVDGNAVKVEGTEFTPADQYTLKLEGAKKVGYRAVAMNGIRDPILIDQIDSFIDEIRAWLKEKSTEMGLSPNEYSVTLNLYGKDGVLGENEFVEETPHEIGVFSDIIAPSQKEAYALSHLFSSMLLHEDYPGRKATAGNTASATSPMDLNAGEVYEFNICNTIEIEDPLEPFKFEMERVGEVIARDSR